MAFSYVGGNVAHGTATTISLSHGQTISEGDLVYIYVNRNDDASISLPTGGTTFIEALQETPPSETAKHAVFWKIAGASEPSSYSIGLGSSSLYQAHVRVYSSAEDAEVDAAATSDVFTGTADLVVTAVNGESISNDALSIIAAGKDNSATVNYTGANNSYVNALGSGDGRFTGTAHRIFTTGETFSQNVTFTDDAEPVTDVSYSIHISFVESAGTPALAPNALDTDVYLDAAITSGDTDQISSITGFQPGATATLNTDGATDLTSATTVTVSVDGISGISVTVSDADTGTFTMPNDLLIGEAVDVILTVDGSNSGAFSGTVESALGEYRTLTSAHADLDLDSPFSDSTYSYLVIGDQIDYESSTSATNLTSGGYDVSMDASTGLFTISDPSGQSGNLAQETESFTVQFATIDASDSNDRSTTRTLTFNPPLAATMEIAVAADIEEVVLFTSPTLFPDGIDADSTIDAVTGDETTLGADSLDTAVAFDTATSYAIDQFTFEEMVSSAIIDPVSTVPSTVMIDIDTDRIRFIG